MYKDEIEFIQLTVLKIIEGTATPDQIAEVIRILQRVRNEVIIDGMKEHLSNE